jgi:preprotein translocase subunit YajC
MAMLHALILLAQDPPPDGGGGGPFGPGLISMTPILLIGLLAYLLLIRPLKRQEAERQALASQVKKNDDVLTSAGIYGTVVDVSETEDKITVRVADNVRLKMTKASIIRNLTNEEAAKAQKAAKEGKA